MTNFKNCFFNSCGPLPTVVGAMCLINAKPSNKLEDMIDQPNKKKKLSSSPDSNDNDAIVEKYQNPTWTIDEVVKETAEANESSKQSNNGIKEELQASSSPKSQQSPTKKSPQQPPPPNPYTNIRRCIVTNDGTTKNLIRLIGLKSLFAKQLPKMPKVSYFFYYIVHPRGNNVSLYVSLL